MRNIPTAIFDFPFLEKIYDEDFVFVFRVEFDGSIRPIVNGQRVESKREICRCAIRVLRQYGYLVDADNKPIPSLYLHCDSLPFFELTYSLYTICSFVDSLPLSVDWSKIKFDGKRFTNDEESETYCAVSVCIDSNNKRRVLASSVCPVYSIASAIRDYLSYKLPGSYILISC